jgi:tetratricopeptide (TPR) repeat protein
VRNWGLINNDPIAYYHAAAHFDPTWSPVTQDRARLADAIAEYRLAIACDPTLARAHGALGQALLHQGEFEAALRATRRATELSGQEHPHEDVLSNQETAALAAQLWRCQRDAELDARLPSIIDGETAPGDGVDSLELAEVCVAKGLSGQATTFYARAFELDPALAADQPAGHLYRAACAAALAGAEAPDDRAPVWRVQSREWLRVELTRYAARLEPADRAQPVRAYFALSHWLTDPALASVRDEALLLRLSPEEVDDCRRLWAEVRAVRERAEKVVDRSAAAAP